MAPLRVNKGVAVLLFCLTSVVFITLRVSLNGGITSGQKLNGVADGGQEQSLLSGQRLTIERDTKVSIKDDVNKETEMQLTVESGELYPDGAYSKEQILKGLVFSDRTQLASMNGELSSNVTLSVVKSLSPGVISHVREIFNDDHNENIYFATIPAIIKRGDSVEVVIRIWLGQFEKMKTLYRNKGWNLNTMFNEWKNSWQENHFYHMILDANYNQLKPGGLMGIPTTTNVKFTYKSDGPMDPRLVQSGDSTLLVFHTWLVDKNSNNEVGGRPHIWDMDRHIKRRLWPHIPLQRTEINWIPLDINGELFFTYSIDPLRVMKCSKEDGDCHFVYEQDGSKENPFLYSSDHLRGGTPWVVYKYPYYISIAHNVASTYKPYQDFAIYNANLVVLNVEEWRVVYVSRNIAANTHWLQTDPVIRNHTIVTPFWYPTGIILQTPDIIDISCHLNDASGHILRLRGLENTLTQVIDTDMRIKTGRGPQVRVIQQYVLESTKQLYKDEWVFMGDIVGKTVEGKDIT